jgi:hypothetical protein
MRMIEPVFGEFAQAKAAPWVTFVEVDLVVGWVLWSCEHGVTATPMFGFFLDRKKVRVSGSVLTFLLRSVLLYRHKI